MLARAKGGERAQWNPDMKRFGARMDVDVGIVQRLAPAWVADLVHKVLRQADLPSSGDGVRLLANHAQVGKPLFTELDELCQARKLGAGSVGRQHVAHLQS